MVFGQRDNEGGGGGSPGIKSEKSYFLKSTIFLHSFIDFTHQIQKEFSKFNHFDACSVNMRFGQKKCYFNYYYIFFYYFSFAFFAVFS